MAQENFFKFLKNKYGGPDAPTTRDANVNAKHT